MNDTQTHIIQLLREHGALTHKQLSERLGLSVVGVIKCFRALKRVGLIEFVKCDRAGRGRPTNAARLSSTAGFSLGISVKRLEVELALVNLQNTVLDFVRLPLSFIEAGRKATHLAVIQKAINKMLRVVPPGRLRGIGISICGNFDYETGQLQIAIDYASIEQADAFRRMLIRKYKVPVWYVHDTETGLISERWCNQSLPPNPTLLYVRDRLGFSLMLQGKLFRGTSLWCPWLGRFQASLPKQEKTYLKGWYMSTPDGTLMLSGTVESWIDQMQGFSPGTRERSSADVERADREELFSRWTQRDPHVQKVVRKGLRNMAGIIRHLCLTLPFDRVILNGWIPGILSLAIEETNTALRESYLDFGAVYKDISPPVTASILGDRADAVGAALWAIDQYLQSRIALRGWKKHKE